MNLDDEELLATRKLLGLDNVADIYVGGIEEAVQTMNKIIDFYKDLDKLHDNKKECKEIQAIKIVLGNLEILADMQRMADKELENARKINEEHQKTNGELREKVKELEIDLTTVYIKGVEDGKDKYKQKIKDEIEKIKKLIDITYEEFLENNKTDIELHNKGIYYEGQINVLKTLLKESEE